MTALEDVPEVRSLTRTLTPYIFRLPVDRNRFHLFFLFIVLAFMISWPMVAQLQMQTQLSQQHQKGKFASLQCILSAPQTAI